MKFIGQIMEYIETMSYSILTIGKSTPPFPAKKGLRQEDPLSSFLFALGMEYFSRCMSTLKYDPSFTYHPRCRKV